MKTEIILKEEISALRFPLAEVLTEAQSIQSRNKALALAMQLGNSLKHKVKILFKDFYKVQMVETTVWFANEQHVVLKGGVVIPTARIIKINL